MHTWNSHLRSVLFRLARTHSHSTIADIERTLGEIFDANTVRFADLEDQPLDPETPLRDVLQRPSRVAITLEIAPGRVHPRSDKERAGQDGPPPPSRFQPEPVLSPEARVDWFIREFSRLEDTHEFMWAGYIVKEFLPRIGLATPEARAMLDQLQDDGIVTVNKLPNPRNPEHPASGVELNRDHPRVQAILQQQASPDDATSAVDATSRSENEQ